MDTSKPLEFDKHGIVQLGPMRVGFVKPGAVSQRRDNPRQMSESELQSLRANIDSMGFKGFVLVEENKPGKFGIVDGHHRMKVLTEKGAPRIPVLLMDPGMSKAQVDLAMLSFNVTGSPREDVFIDFIRDLVDQVGSEIVAEHVALDQGFLDDLSETLEKALALSELGNLDGESTGGGRADDGEFWQGRPLRIELVNNAETRALLEKVRELTGQDTDGQAVLFALKEFVKMRSLDYDEAEDGTYAAEAG